MNKRKPSDKLAWLFRTCCFAAMICFPLTASADDWDLDGLDDTIDPDPYDGTNWSSANGIYWYYGAISDNDVDGIINYSDSTPFPDTDGDGFYEGGDGMIFPIDPSPNDYANFSNSNFYNWYGDIFGDADGDWELNFWDYYPYDADNDGINDGSDPYPNDGTNYSSINGISWYSDLFGDLDGDNLLNWEDPNPYDNDFD